jgi:hypothetical protein
MSPCVPTDVERTPRVVFKMSHCTCKCRTSLRNASFSAFKRAMPERFLGERGGGDALQLQLRNSSAGMPSSSAASSTVLPVLRRNSTAARLKFSSYCLRVSFLFRINSVSTNVSFSKPRATIKNANRPHFRRNAQQSGDKRVTRGRVQLKPRTGQGAAGHIDPADEKVCHEEKRQADEVNRLRTIEKDAHTHQQSARQ